MDKPIHSIGGQGSAYPSHFAVMSLAWRVCLFYLSIGLAPMHCPNELSYAKNLKPILVYPAWLVGDADLGAVLFYLFNGHIGRDEP